MLWITGGPGCSSITGLLYEIGPIQFEAMHYNGSLPTLTLTPNSWTKVSPLSLSQYTHISFSLSLSVYIYIYIYIYRYKRVKTQDAMA
ncbi:putative peptidase S10, serine carboxypeptidase, alpha/Beta hydrolase [Helianthus anomalus]